MDAGRIHPPWDEKVVAGLNRWQSNCLVHPFTCDKGHDLIAGPNGWACPACDYKQGWAWAFMADGGPVLRGEPLRLVVDRKD